MEIYNKGSERCHTISAYGVMAGAVMGLILNAMNARRERKGKEAFPMAGLMVFSLYLMIILVITFFSREDGSRNRAMDLELSPPGGSIREITPSWWKMYCFHPVWLCVPLGISLA